MVDPAHHDERRLAASAVLMGAPTPRLEPIPGVDMNRLARLSREAVGDLEEAERVVIAAYNMGRRRELSQWLGSVARLLGGLDRPA